MKPLLHGYRLQRALVGQITAFMFNTGFVPACCSLFRSCLRGACKAGCRHRLLCTLVPSHGQRQRQQFTLLSPGMYSLPGNCCLHADLGGFVGLLFYECGFNVSDLACTACGPSCGIPHHSLIDATRLTERQFHFLHLGSELAAESAADAQQAA